MSNYSVIALALGYVAHPAVLTPVPTHHVSPLRSIATVISRAVPSPSPSLSPLPLWRVHALARAGAQASGLDAELVLAVIESESAGDPNAVSSAGAVGMMQIMPATAHDCGIRTRWVALSNVQCGSKTLALLVRRYGLTVALACYNAGATTIDRAGTAHASRWPSETKIYVRVVVERYDALQR